MVKTAQRTVIKTISRIRDGSAQSESFTEQSQKRFSRVFETVGITMPKSKSKSKKAGTTKYKAWGDMAEKFLSRLDSEQHDHQGGCHGSERDCAALVLQHFIAWVVDREHHYHDDGYLIPFGQHTISARRSTAKRKPISRSS